MDEEGTTVHLSIALGMMYFFAWTTVTLMELYFQSMVTGFYDAGSSNNAEVSSVISNDH